MSSTDPFPGIKYVLHPGEVMSINDWETHHVNVRHLCDLYQVPFHQCLVWEEPHGVIGYRQELLSRLLHLHPRGAGYRPVSERERELYPLSKPDPHAPVNPFYGWVGAHFI